MNDELFERMQAIDPVTTPVHPSDGDVARTLRENIMNSTIDHGTAPSPAPEARVRRRRLGLGLGGLGVAGAAAVVGLALTGGSAPTSITADLPGGDAAVRCIPVLDQEPDLSAAAFGGTVVEVGETTLTVEVDEWYLNGDADRVVITASDTGMNETGLEGDAFVVGAELLVTVIDGTVRTCGASGVATPELQAVYSTWYG